MTNKRDPGTVPIAPREAAALLGISTRTVARWADTGKLHPVTLPSGHRRYRRAEVEALVKPVEVHR